ncbi:MAG: caspase family protein [Halobacteriota archaeon]
MAKGIGLALGLNAVDPGHYAGWEGTLVACENDANDMAKIYTSGGFEVTTLLTRDATRKNLFDGIARAADTLKAGDIFVVSYSGHGGQVPDITGEEIDDMDETWCLYDGQLIDDELNVQFGKFVEGVRVLVFSDSCHSGTSTKALYVRSTRPTTSKSRYRYMPIEWVSRVYLKNKAFYDKIMKEIPKDAEDEVKASVLLISGCLDDQFSSDGDTNGLFTSQLLYVWNDGQFKGNYRLFHKRIRKLMPPQQTPNYYPTGERNPEFEKQQVFEI